MTDSVRTKLNNGAYTTALKWPMAPNFPSVLNKKASELTADELANLVATKAEYEAAIAKTKEDRKAYNADTGRLTDMFRRDLEAELGVTDHPKAAMLWAKAWENGHSSGLSEVMIVYEDLVDLIL